MPTGDQVCAVIEELHGEARLASANILVDRLGGSKSEMLKLRDAAYARLLAQGKSTDHLSELQSAVEPMLRKLMEVAERRRGPIRRRSID